MNKNTKKFVVTLLSVLMVLSFMPAMAFAQNVTDPEDGQVVVLPDDHTWERDKDNDVPAEKCGEIGIKAWKCSFDQFDQDCEEVAYTPVVKGHNDQKVKMSIKDYLDAVASQTDGDAQAKATAVAIAKGALNADTCYVFVKQCKDCLRVDTTTVEQVAHKRASSVLCADSECSVCGAKMVATQAHNNFNVEKTETYENFCGHTGSKRETTICPDCGERAITYFEFPDAAGTRDNVWKGHNWGTKIDISTAEKKTAAEKMVADGLAVKFDENTYYPTTVVVEPTCESKGASILTCKDCGLNYDPTPAWQWSVWGTPYEVQEVYYRNPSERGGMVHNYSFNNKYADCLIEIPATTTHTTQHFEVAATCGSPACSFDLCTVCNKKFNVHTGVDTLKHEYSVEVLKAPTCLVDGVTVIKCTKCGREALASTLMTAGHISTDAAKDLDPTGKKLYFWGFNDEYKTGLAKLNAIEVADWRAAGHKYGAYEVMEEPTCLYGAVEAEKCSVCGMYNIHTAKETGKALGHDEVTTIIPPRCGDYGYEIVSCQRCKKELSHKQTDKPVKYYGAECTFAWGDLDENTEAEICTVCGYVKPGTETPKTEEKKAKEAAEAAKPVISAAADIMNDSANYKADSIKAIEEAKANLNVAISAGSADQIRQRTAELQAAINAAQKKDANPMTAKGKTVKATSKKAKTFTAKKAFTVKNAQGKVTYKKANKKGGAKIKVAKNGKVTVKKGLKKGTYKVKVKVTAAGNGDYLKKTKAVTLTVKITK